ncbi:MAG TPA: LLM class flavin-dependent oxidoreductase, partial [Candidatus Binataceae bacterium]|nr:LLM class flavin-dependent oxidoreductase [Candidatus Binataceae bacterium]
LEIAAFVQNVEQLGFSTFWYPEGPGYESLSMGGFLLAQSQRLKIGSSIASIYARDAYAARRGMLGLNRLHGERFILGLGVSHRPALEQRGIDMGNARDRLRRDTKVIRDAFSGAIDMFGLKFRAPKHPIPIYYAALAMETSKLAGELADGLMLYMCSPDRMRKSIDAARNVAPQHGRKPADITATCGLSVFLHDDMKTAYAAARQGLAFYGALPFYNRIMTNSGFAGPAAQIMAAAKRSDQAAMVAAVTDQLADAVALVGPASRCIERLAAYRERGCDVPILVPNPIGEDYGAGVRRVLQAFAKLN